MNYTNYFSQNMSVMLTDVKGKLQDIQNALHNTIEEINIDEEKKRSISEMKTNNERKNEELEHMLQLDSMEAGLKFMGNFLLINNNGNKLVGYTSPQKKTNHPSNCVHCSYIIKPITMKLDS